MKRVIFTVFLSFFAFLITNAQTSETISELTPVPSNIGKFAERLPKNESIFGGYKIKFETNLEFINLHENKKGIAVTVKTIYEELIFEYDGGKPTARIDIYGRITSKDKLTDGFFEERLVVIAKAEDLTNAPKTLVVLRRVFELPEGKYQIGLIVRDVFVGNRTVKIIKFQIPQTTKQPQQNRK